MQFGLAKTQKYMWIAITILLALTVVLFGGRMTGVAGTVLFMGLGIALGLASYFVSYGWWFQLEFTEGAIRVTPIRNQHIVVPLEKVGMLLENGGFPFKTYWLVCKNFDAGREIPSKGINPKTAEMLHAYRKRNPGKQLSIVQLPGGYIRSIKAFAEELKRRIPPVTVDDRVLK